MSSESPRPCALVSGGTRGIGQAVVHRLLEEGYHVAFTYRRDASAARQACDAMSRSCAGDQKLVAFELDLASPDSVQALPQQVVETFGALDVLVNNAGQTDDGAFLTMAAPRWQAVIEANFGGTASLCLAAIPYLLRSARPALVNVASLAGLAGKEGQVAYAASKGALIGLTQWLAWRFGPQGLQVNAVAPGFIHTQMVEGLEPSMVDHILKGTSMGRMGSAREVADAIAFLLRPGYVQAATLRIDGGFKR